MSKKRKAASETGGRSLVATTIIDPIKPANPTNDVARKTCEDKTQLKNRIVGECSISDIATEGIPTQCLIDTGCVISTISESFILNNMKDTAIKDLQDLLDDVTFESASGDPMKFNGYIVTTTSITIPDLGQHDVILLVVNDTVFHQEVPLLIGTNILGLMPEHTHCSSVWKKSVSYCHRLYANIGLVYCPK